ncbi:10168_t:CDS:2 [Paraglomus brasilianum]|uniref:10168_t:CDS:1 n=1 Tax=Paraglomus brasilianum TaxID=144538 RepID=A0A9N9CJA3_9GLOM|nr:10168_t:CDS:2 [Paraglomus brasilianum]
MSNIKRTGVTTEVVVPNKKMSRHARYNKKRKLEKERQNPRETKSDLIAIQNLILLLKQVPVPSSIIQIDDVIFDPNRDDLTKLLSNILRQKLSSYICGLTDTGLFTSIIVTGPNMQLVAYVHKIKFYTSNKSGKAPLSVRRIVYRQKKDKTREKVLVEELLIEILVRELRLTGSVGTPEIPSDFQEFSSYL